MRNAVICGVGAALPANEVSNAQLCAELDITDEWISKRTGISRRRFAPSGLTTEDLAAAASEIALKSAGGCDVQGVVLATTTPDHRTPATAPGVATRLGLGSIPAFDLSAGCTGFLYGLATGAGLIASAQADAVLVVGVERLSTLPDLTDPVTRPIFGDGAGAVVLRAGTAQEPGALGPLVLGSDGEQSELILAPTTTTRNLRMEGRTVFRHAVTRMSEACHTALERAGWDLRDVDRIAAHQANARITTFLGEHLGLGPERRLHNIERVGNTGAASIPLLLAESVGSGDLASGHRLLLTAFGSGLTWGATTLVWPDLDTTVENLVKD
ncbi:beta-ketoacyl-ACP synthase III [Streptomyces sp. VB1]|uniref:beta-ketoacyl-ACP synthase III n=1 Tax=Streptomyces sp. VB1 TaxID=2986803 RepID=UPI0022420D31|nr:beta-ketoacyl-ACP synthase III [Streptomyces sp. VB1]UZI32375.1 ketoacyl-ACP synthase III [Streptomyces sp. VB1]